jgi:hypothetical protein
VRLGARRIRRSASWIAGLAVAAIVGWAVIVPTTVASPNLGRLLLDLVVAGRPAPALYSMEGDGPPLGEPHDWYVVASDGNELARIDLVDGDVTGYRLEGYPQAAVRAGRAGTELILAGPAPQPVYAVSIDDPAGPRRQLFRWPLDARDPVNAAYYAVERIDDGTIRVGHIRLDGIALVRAVVDIDLATGRRHPASTGMETGEFSRWLSQWIGNATASTDDGEIIAGPASKIGQRAVLVRHRRSDTFHNPVSIPLWFRPEKVMLIPKTSALSAKPASGAAAGSSPSTASTSPPASTMSTTSSTSPVGSSPDPLSIDPMAARLTDPETPVPAAVLEELSRLGHDYLIAGNHRSFHRIDLATGDVGRFDLGLRVVGVTSSGGGAELDRSELIAIIPGSAVVALAAADPTLPGRRLLSLRPDRDGADGPISARVVLLPDGARGDIEYWDRSGSQGTWRRLDLDFVAAGPVAGPYRLAPGDRGVVVTDEGNEERYLLPVSIAGGVSTVLLV